MNARRFALLAALGLTSLALLGLDFAAGGRACARDELACARVRAQETTVDLAGARAALERLAKAMEKVERLRARYTQRQESLLLAEPILSKGTLHLRADPGCILLELGGERIVRVRSDAKSHQVYWPEEKRAERWLFRSNELARALLRCFSADVRRMEEVFEIRGYTRGELVSEVVLTPRDSKLHRYLASLKLSLDSASSQLVALAHENAEGEHVRFELADVDLDPDAKLEDALLDEPLPKEVRLLVHEVKDPLGK